MALLNCNSVLHYTIGLKPTSSAQEFFCRFSHLQTTMVQIFRPCSVLISRERALREATVLCGECEWREWRAAVSGSRLHLSRKNIESLILCDAPHSAECTHRHRINISTVLSCLYLKGMSRLFVVQCSELQYECSILGIWGIFFRLRMNYSAMNLRWSFV